jgi:hypothetical protein
MRPPRAIAVVVAVVLVAAGCGGSTAATPRTATAPAIATATPVPLPAPTSPTVAVDLERKAMARALVADLRRIDRPLVENRTRCAAAVAASGTTVTAIFGISDVLAAKILGHAGDVSLVTVAGVNNVYERVRNEYQVLTPIDLRLTPRLRI